MNGTSPAWRLWCAFPHENLLCGGWPIRHILGFWGSKVPQNGRFLAQDAHEPPWKFDAASFILAGEICNHTNKQRNKQKTVTNISTPCLSACVSILYNARHMTSSKVPLAVGDLDRIQTWFLEPTRVRPQTASRSRLVFSQLTRVQNTQTDTTHTYRKHYVRHL